MQPHSVILFTSFLNNIDDRQAKRFPILTDSLFFLCTHRSFRTVFIISPLCDMMIKTERNLKSEPSGSKKKKETSSCGQKLR